MNSTHYPKINYVKSNIYKFRQKSISSILKLADKFKKDQTSSPYLEGVFKPVHETEIKQFNIQGQIPDQLDGLYVRIGPNPMRVKAEQTHHWFIGDGMVHGIKISNGQVDWFKSKYVETDSIQKIKQQQPKAGFRRGSGDIVNTNIFYHANKLWAVIEAGTFPVRMDLQLNSEKHQLFNTDADLPFSAHPHRDPDSQDLHTICYDAFDQSHAYYEVIDQFGRLVHFTKIPVEHGPMIHDCAITEKDILIFDFPVTFSKKQIKNANPLPYEWNPQHQARIGILPLYAEVDQIQWINIEPCFVFHAANAYRNENDQIILDIVVYDRMFDHSKIGPFEQQKVKLERWTIDLNTYQIDHQVIDENAQEFPRIDERFTGRKYRYLYSVGFDTTDLFCPNAIYIYDLFEQQKTAYFYGDEWITGEVVFVPENSKALEGQGYLMSFVHHIHEHASKFVILKINGLDVHLQAEVDLSVRVPIGFHGNWVDLSH